MKYSIKKQMIAIFIGLLVCMVAVLLVADLFLLTGDFWLLGCALGALTAALAVICKVKKM